MRIARREVVEAEQARIEADVQNDFYRRARLNRAVGMSSRCPWAFQLSQEELEQAERDVAGDHHPIPIWRDGGDGMMILGDPYHCRGPNSGGWALLFEVLGEKAGVKLEVK